MKRARAFAVALCAAVGCGDNFVPELELEPSSGSRLQLAWYLFDDGSRQLEPDAFYDLVRHARCVPRLWGDGVVRCVPDADPAAFADAGCTIAVGRVRTIQEPSYFIGYDQRDDAAVPIHLFRAAAARTSVDLIFEQRDGACVGPLQPRRGEQFHEIASELGPDDMVPLEEAQLGDGRIGLRMRASADGMRAPIGLYDRVLGFDCTTSASLGDAVACEPVGATTATLFVDNACTEPAVIVDGDAAPQTARVVDPAGCATFHGVGGLVATLVYRRDGDRCTRTTLGPTQTAFAVGAPLSLASLERFVEPRSDRRLHRVLLIDGPLRFAHDRLLDTATRAECQPQPRDAGVRCIPRLTVPVRTLFRPGCTVETRIAELPETTCEPIAFASRLTDGGVDVHAIGDAAEDSLFDSTSDGCVPYAPPLGMRAHALGPALPVETFVGGYEIGER